MSAGHGLPWSKPTSHAVMCLEPARGRAPRDTMLSQPIVPTYSECKHQVSCSARCAWRLRMAEHGCTAGAFCAGCATRLLWVWSHMAWLLAMHAMSMGCLCFG